MNAAGWFVVGMLLGCSVGTVLAGLMAAARRGDDLATFANLETRRDQLRVIDGGDAS